MKTLDPLAGVSTFIALAETLNFGAAAAQLRMSRATASAQIADLEQRLGVRLFHRSTRAVRLTEAGAAYRAALGGIAGQARQAAELAQSYQQEAVGRIRVTVPDFIAETYIVPALAAFLEDQPGLVVELVTTSRRVDIVGEDFDLAIRASLAVEPSLIVRRLATSPVGLFASPGYLKRYPPVRHPDDLGAHRLINHSSLKSGGGWVLKRGKREARVPVRPLLVADTGRVLADAALAGLGIVFLPRFIVAERLRTKELVAVLPDWPAETVDVNAVYPSNRNITPKVRRFVSLVAKRLAGHPDFA